MLFTKLCMFVFAMNLAIGVMSVLNVPMQCTGSECVYFSNVFESDFYDFFMSHIDDSTYKTTQITNSNNGINQATEIFNAVSLGLATLSIFSSACISGIPSVTAFFLCQGNTCATVGGEYGTFANSIVDLMQLILYISYAFLIAQFIRGVLIEK